MRVKTQHNLQPSTIPAHSVVIEDDLGNPVFAAVQLPDSIVCATAGDPDFQSVLDMLGITKTVNVREFKPKPAKNIIWTP